MEDDKTKKNFEDDDSDEDDQDFHCDDDSSEEEESEEEPEAKRRRVEQEEQEKEKVKSEADALWEAMLGTKATPSKPAQTTQTTPKPAPKPSTPTSTKATTKTPPTSAPTTPKPQSSLASVLAKAKQEDPPGVKTFKFAGETVATDEVLGAATPGGNKRKREANIGALLGSLKGKKKISTLDKSALDWETFKTKTGIEDELEQETKDGYLERQAFLARADVRQFEVERGLRTVARNTRDKK